MVIIHKNFLRPNISESTEHKIFQPFLERRGDWTYCALAIRHLSQEDAVATIYGPHSYTYPSLGSAGDINNDGFEDLLWSSGCAAVDSDTLDQFIYMSVAIPTVFSGIIFGLLLMIAKISCFGFFILDSSMK